MTKALAPMKLIEFDAARYLNDDEAIAEYMTAVLETNDPDLLLLALSDVARAKGMAQVAKDAGLGRESLYKALAPGAKPGSGSTRPFSALVPLSQPSGRRSPSG